MVAASVETRLAAAWNALGDVNDPEIPTVSVVDLGVIRTVAFSSDGRALEIELMPTFVGCPAVDVMRDEITAKLSALGIADEVRVALSFVEAWTSERITARGRERLRRSGFAPPVPQGRIPPDRDPLDELAVLPIASCPYCGSRNTTLENPFGPTLCRAIYHCAACRQPFEQFKTV